MVGEARTGSSLYSAAYRLLSESILARRATGVMPVFEGGRRYKRPTIVLPNGFDPSTVPVPPAPPDQGVRVIMLVANSNPWSGLDRLIELARRLPSIGVDIVGPVTRSTMCGPVPDNVIMSEKRLNPAEYRAKLCSATAGIGPLASDRKGVYRGGALKTREYLAHGLPVILGQEDVAIPKDADWALTGICSGDNPVTAAIPEFLESWRSRRVERSDVEHMSAAAIERQRLVFIRRIMSK
jgi:glycosyltransferase involved in cell wall biosynthesis